MQAIPKPNEVVDELGQWVLWKNPQAYPTGSLDFKGITIEWGTEWGLNKIRRIIYPKTTYDRAAVEKIAADTVNCPFCREGKEPEPPLPGAESGFWEQFTARTASAWNKFWGLPAPG